MTMMMVFTVIYTYSPAIYSHIHVQSHCVQAQFTGTFFYQPARGQKPYLSDNDELEVKRALR